jgi:hypothetical protein
MGTVILDHVRPSTTSRPSLHSNFTGISLVLLPNLHFSLNPLTSNTTPLPVAYKTNAPESPSSQGYQSSHCMHNKVHEGT